MLVDCTESKLFIPVKGANAIDNKQRQNWNMGLLWDPDETKSNLNAYTYAYGDELEESGDPSYTCNTGKIQSLDNIYKLEHICEKIKFDITNNKYYIDKSIKPSTIDSISGYYVNIYD